MNISGRFDVHYVYLYFGAKDGNMRMKNRQRIWTAAIAVCAVLLLIVGVLPEYGERAAAPEDSSAPAAASGASASSVPAADNGNTPSSAADGGSPVSPVPPETPRPRLMEHLALQLDMLSAPPSDMALWVREIALEYDAEPVQVLEADIDGDGRSEWIAVLHASAVDPQSHAVERRSAYGIVIAHGDGRFQLHSVPFGEDHFWSMRVEAVDDLTGDGKPDIVWRSVGVGAHTSLFTYTLSTWADGQLTTLSSRAEIPNVGDARVEDGQLLLTGGLIGSAGAGVWQREYTDVYSVLDGEWRHVDRRFAEAQTPYDFLIDGLWAEELGHPERAQASYTQAAGAAGASYDELGFWIDGEWLDGEALNTFTGTFEHVVISFALLRKELLRDSSLHSNAEQACSNAKTKSGYTPEWLPVLNAPAGYANPSWNENTVCSAISGLF